MKPLFYDDNLDEALPRSDSSIFLAGPTAPGVMRTPWRANALALLQKHAYSGFVLLPEFRDSPFLEAAPRVFGKGESPVPGMRVTTYNILRWETVGIERATIVLFWMPFRITADTDPASLPGFTTRAEVSRELQRAPERLVLGMPADAFSSGHIRYHAHHAGLHIEPRGHGRLRNVAPATVRLRRRDRSYTHLESSRVAW